MFWNRLMYVLSRGIARRPRFQRLRITIPLPIQSRIGRGYNYDVSKLDYALILMIPTESLSIEIS